MDDCGLPPKEDEIEMGLKARIRLSQSKKAWTQYVTIPSAVVQDSQYPFRPDEELCLEVEPTIGVIVISRHERPLKITSAGDLIIAGSKISEAELIVKHQIKEEREK